ncbi:MAG: hypothetical protein IKN63_05275 [Bacilli bacterium]|nr:hypothetical protein [Bacilli bacterium]
MLEFLYKNLEIIITNAVISLIMILIYNIIKNKGKLYFNILKLKVNIQSKDNWSTSNTIDDTTKEVNLDFKLELYNHNNRYNSIYEIKVIKKKLFKFIEINNSYLNLTNTLKTLSGSKTYEKLKYMNFLPYEVKTFNIKIILTKDEFITIKKLPLYIIYKEGKKLHKVKLSKYIKKIKK